MAVDEPRVSSVAFAAWGLQSRLRGLSEVVVGLISFFFVYLSQSPSMCYDNKNITH